MTTTTTPIVLNLEINNQSLNMKLEGMDSELARVVLGKALETFLDGLNKQETVLTTVPVQQPVTIAEEEQDKEEKDEEPFHVVIDENDKVVSLKKVIDTQNYKNEETEIAHMLIKDKDINTRSYFVTPNGVLKVQTFYACKCGWKCKKHLPYPVKTTAVCGGCGKGIKLKEVGVFPSVDIFGNFYADIKKTY